MAALLDVNVLIALLDSDHSLHERAVDWFSSHAKNRWSSCPITQNGCVRVMSHPGYPTPVPAKPAVARLCEAVRDRTHEFWPDDLSIVDGRTLDASRIHGPRQITDMYLLSLAVKRSGCFVTFDNRVAIEAVRGARRQNLLTL